MERAKTLPVELHLDIAFDAPKKQNGTQKQI